MVDDEAGVLHFGGVGGFGADAVGLLRKDAVAAVDAAAHDEIGNDSLLAVGALADDDAPAGVAVARQVLLDIHWFHGDAPL